MPTAGGTAALHAACAHTCCPARPQAPDGGPITTQPSKGAIIPLPHVDTQLPLQKSFLGGTRADDVTELYDIGPILGAGKVGDERRDRQTRGAGGGGTREVSLQRHLRS